MVVIRLCVSLVMKDICSQSKNADGRQTPTILTGNIQISYKVLIHNMLTIFGCQTLHIYGLLVMSCICTWLQTHIHMQ